MSGIGYFDPQAVISLSCRAQKHYGHVCMAVQQMPTLEGAHTVTTSNNVWAKKHSFPCQLIVY